MLLVMVVTTINILIEQSILINLSLNIHKTEYENNN